MISSLLKRITGMRRSVDEVLANADANLTSGALIDEYHDMRINRLIIMVAAVGFAIFIGLISFTPIHEVSTGTGEILPVGFVQTVEHLEGGRVLKIYAKEGDRVQAGDPIVSLDPVALKAELEKARARLSAVREELALQKWSISEKGLNFTAELTLRGGLAEKTTEVTAIAEDDNYRQAQLNVITAAISADEASAEKLLLQQKKEEEKLDLVRDRLTDFQSAFQIGAVSKQELNKIRSEKIDIESNLLQLQTKYQGTLSNIAASKAKYQELRAEFRREAATVIAAKEAEAQELEATVTQLKDRLANQIIRAPSNGVVNRLEIKSQGQVIVPGSLVAEIVPDSGELFAEIKIPGDRVGFISKGMDARMKVLAFDYTRFGAIDTTVSDISATSIRSEQDGALFYRVRLAFKTDHMGSGASHMQLAPGMPVIADIVLQKKSVLSYLLKPLRSISDRAFTEQ